MKTAEIRHFLALQARRKANAEKSFAGGTAREMARKSVQKACSLFRA
jgi:hypothetical protein